MELSVLFTEVYFITSKNESITLCVGHVPNTKKSATPSRDTSVFQGKCLCIGAAWKLLQTIFIALPSIRYELIEVYGVMPANSSCMKHWEPTDAMELVWN